jgi:hypothetical protein
MFALYDLFPITRHQIRDIPVIPGTNHDMFPRIPIYDITAIPKSPSTFIELPAYCLDTWPCANYVIPTISSLHYTRLYTEEKYMAQVLQSSAHQFGLIQIVGPGSEESILIRQGNYIMLLGELWKLVLVIFEQDKVQLFYQPQVQPVPMLLRIVKEKVAEPEFTGKYELVDLTSHS